MGGMIRRKDQAPGIVLPLYEGMQNYVFSLPNHVMGAIQKTLESMATGTCRLINKVLCEGRKNQIRRSPSR